MEKSGSFFRKRSVIHLGSVIHFSNVRLSISRHHLAQSYEISLHHYKYTKVNSKSTVEVSKPELKLANYLNYAGNQREKKWWLWTWFQEEGSFKLGQEYKRRKIKGDKHNFNFSHTGLLNSSRNWADISQNLAKSQIQIWKKCAW